MRLDKWLWAARFFKMRPLAQAAVNGGKVHYNGQRVKASHSVQLDAEISIRKGPYEFIIIVTGLSEKRGNATEAAKLYCETEESIKAREVLCEQRRLINASVQRPSEKPNKKDRQHIIRFKRKPE